MQKLDHIEARELQSPLEDAATAKAAKRLMVALAYKDGVTVQEIERRYGVPQSTIYYWLSRFEDQPLDDAVDDEPKPGRPPKLDDKRRETVRSWLEDSPQSADGEQLTWTASRLRERIEEEFDVEYSEAHVRRVFLD